MKNSKNSKAVHALLVLMLSTAAAFAQSTQTPPNSAQSSPNSDIRASDKPVPRAAPGGTLMQKPARSKGVSMANCNALTNVQASASPTFAGNDTDLPRLINACAAAADELAKTRVLVVALENENARLKERIETERRVTEILLELNESRKSETASLHATVTAKNETIAAKDAVNASQEKLITNFKSKKSSLWKRVGDVLIGIAAGAILR